MMAHGDSIISGVAEERPDNRPKCGYKIEVKLSTGGTTREPCGSEEGLRTVHGTGLSGRKKDTPVCNRHIEKAWHDWKVDSAD